jgi:hypothetical protein
MSKIRAGICAGVAMLALALVLTAIPERAASPMPQVGGSEPVPAFHSEVPKGPLPGTLDPAQFDNVVIQNAYALAAKTKRVLYQQPCYCHCDRSQGHGSLLDCFAGKHAAECGVCIKEGLYSYEQTKKGKTAVQIRDGIEKGEWQQVDLSKYQTPVAPTAPAK